MILPIRHCETVFDLSEVEVSDTFKLLAWCRGDLQKICSPSGFNVGWNCYESGGQTTPHAHMHVIPRFDDEPFTGRGIRHWFKLPENARVKKS